MEVKEVCCERARNSAEDKISWKELVLTLL